MVCKSHVNKSKHLFSRSCTSCIKLHKQQLKQTDAHTPRAFDKLNRFFSLWLINMTFNSNNVFETVKPSHVTILNITVHDVQKVFRLEFFIINHDFNVQF